MWKPAGLRSTADDSPFLSVRTGSTNTDGSRAGVRQPRLPPCCASFASDQVAATCAKSSPSLHAVASASSRAPLPLLDLLGRALLGNAHEDVRDQVLVLAAGLRGDRREVVVDLGVGDEDLAVDLAVAQPLDHDLAADVLDGTCGTTMPSRSSILRNSSADSLFSCAMRRIVALDRRVVDADAGLLRVLQQRALGDEPLEHLLVEHVRRGRLQPRLAELLHQDALLLVHLVLRERLVVDDGDDAVERDRAAASEGDGTGAGRSVGGTGRGPSGCCIVGPSGVCGCAWAAGPRRARAARAANAAAAERR